MPRVGGEASAIQLEAEQFLRILRLQMLLIHQIPIIVASAHSAIVLSFLSVRSRVVVIRRRQRVYWLSARYERVKK